MPGILLTRSEILKAIEEKRIQISPFSQEKLRGVWYALYPEKLHCDIEGEIPEPLIEERILADRADYLLEPQEYVEVFVREKIVLSEEFVGFFTPASITIDEGLILTMGKLDPNYKLPIKFAAYNAKPHPVYISSTIPIAHVHFYHVGADAIPELEPSEYERLVRRIRAPENRDEALRIIEAFLKDDKSK